VFNWMQMVDGLIEWMLDRLVPSRQPCDKGTQWLAFTCMHLQFMSALAVQQTLPLHPP
jgi:hypothetical protein